MPGVPQSEEVSEANIEFGEHPRRMAHVVAQILRLTLDGSMAFGKALVHAQRSSDQSAEPPL